MPFFVVVVVVVCFCITLLLLFVVVVFFFFKCDCDWVCGWVCDSLIGVHVYNLRVTVAQFLIMFVSHWFCDHVHFWVSDSVDVQALQELTKPHIDSYNYLLNEGLHKMVQVQTLSTQQAPCILNTLLQLLSHHQRLWNLKGTFVDFLNLSCIIPRRTEEEMNREIPTKAFFETTKYLMLTLAKHQHTYTHTCMHI